MIIVESSGITDVGRKRKGNEDSLFLDDDMQLYVVADGMGGHKAGEVASRLVVETIRDYFKPSRERLDQEIFSDPEKTLSRDAQRLSSGILLANQVVYESSQNNESNRGMGSTVSSVLFTGNTLIVANVGDSPVYRIRNGRIETLSVLHTMMAEFLAIAPKGAKLPGEQYRHVLTRAMGTKETVKPDISETKPLKGDIIVISSDGLSDKVSPEEIPEVVINKQPHESCRSLVDMANERGGEDNITVIVLKIIDLGSDDLQQAVERDVSEPKKEKPRKKPQIVVDYDTDDDSHRSFIHKISSGGVFIETREAFTVGEELLLAFSVLNEQNSFMVNGKIVRREAKGIDVKFINLTGKQQDMIKTLGDKIGGNNES